MRDYSAFKTTMPNNKGEVQVYMTGQYSHEYRLSPSAVCLYLGFPMTKKNLEVCEKILPEYNQSYLGYFDSKKELNTAIDRWNCLIQACKFKLQTEELKGDTLTKEWLSKKGLLPK